MKHVSEPARRLPVYTEADVVVCGGGPSGFIAATAAAHMGARTLLLERHGFLGGMATAGMVGPMSKFNLGGKRIVGGLPEEFLQRLHAAGGAVIDLPSGNVPYDVEVYKLVSQRMVRAAGVEVLYHAQVAGTVETEDGRISHVIMETNSGRQAIAAKQVIDCTGIGDLICKTSLPWEMRNQRRSGELQPMSLYFRVGGVDTGRLTLMMAHDQTKYANPELRKLFEGEVLAGRLRNFGGPWAVHGSTLREGEVSVNATRMSGNAADARDFSRAEQVLREEVHLMVNLMRRGHPAFARCYLIDTAAQVGIRETRSILGLYSMTEDDILNPKPFPDTVAKGGHPIDIHLPGDSRQSARFLEKPYNIPYRSIVPKGSRNVLVAGGCVSASREAFASIRVQAQCMALGQAAGVSASLCARHGCGVEEIDCARLRGQLLEMKAIL